MTILNTAEDVRRAVVDGHKVFADTEAYPVIRDSIGQFLITCTMTEMCIGLTHRDGKTLNGKTFFRLD